MDNGFVTGSDISSTSRSGIIAFHLSPSVWAFFSSLTLFAAGNAWLCSPKLSWMYSWSRHYAESSILQHVDDTRCRYDETTRNCLKQKECGNLLLVMEYYHEKVNPSCPSSCSCFLTQVQEVMKERKERSYTVQVNCTSQNLTYFPKLPIHTRIVDLSDNKVRGDIIE